MALPQTQCTRCGYPDCRAYAEAVAAGDADINRCPPGGAEGIVRLAAISGRPFRPLDPDCGVEGPRRVARVVEPDCIGCTLCIQACPVDCIVGAAKMMHTVVEADCTGCELCIPACPVDCIELHPAPDGSGRGQGEAGGWAAWSPEQAGAARRAYEFRTERLAREQRQEDERLARIASARRPAAAGS